MRCLKGKIKMKKFIITIDTEGDNQWERKNGESISTENAAYLQRFQDLCNKYRFKPVYLTNYEMIQDDRFVSFAKEQSGKGNCEVGMHLHAWNSPPEYALEKQNQGNSYLIEYPKSVMEEKIKYLTEYIERVIGQRPISHRAGRWAMDQRYYDLLIKYGYKVDCSVTPLVNWETSPGATPGSMGSDYRKKPQSAYPVKGEGGVIWELPMSIRKLYFPDKRKRSLRSLMGSLLHGRIVWMRPSVADCLDMCRIADYISRSEEGYLMFMIHSSELMPGGSVYYKSEREIEGLYVDLEDVFAHISKGYEGITIKDYYEQYLKQR